MADYIDREELLNKITRQPIHYIGGVKGYLEIKNIVNAMPSVDAVAVVRCKDCKNRHKDFCLRLGELDEEQNSYFLIVKDTDFCKWGEKE